MIIKKVTIPDIGLVKLKFNHNYKRLSIRVLHNTEIIINVPNSYHYKDVKIFVLKNKKWIKKQIQKYKKLNYTFCFTTNLRIYNKPLHFVKSTQSKHSIKSEVLKDRILVHVSNSVNIREKPIQNEIKECIISILQKEGKVILNQKTAHLAIIHKFSYNKLTVKNIKSRWGSCSPSNNINLSIYLLLLPEDLINYVILHELCHTKIKNHSATFWELLHKHLNKDPKFLQKKLRKYFFLPLYFS